MAIKDIIVHIDNSQACKKRLLAAIQLAQSHEAHLTGLYVMRPLANLMMYPIEPIVGHVRDVIRKPLLDAKDNARTLFEATTGKSGIVAEWRDVEEGVTRALNTTARCADLVILGQHQADDSADQSEGLADRVLLGSGRPCLVVPYIGARETLGKRILVAWDGRREAARAVHDALPILQGAAHVSVLAVDPSASDGEIPCVDICHHLARHEVEAEAVSHTVADVDVGTFLLSYAADLDTDMIVMGAYGHSRLSEVMMGGVTRTLLRDMRVPVFMSH